MSQPRRGIFLDGQFQDVGTARVIRDPLDGAEVAVVRFGGPEVVERAVAGAARAAGDMAALPRHRRVDILRHMRRLIARRADELTEAIRAEAGKPVRFARIEVDRCLDTFADAAECARREDAELLPLDGFAPGEGRLGLVRRIPVGPVAAITPFNFPLNLVAHKVAPAIAAGCPCVLKPASQTPSPALILGEIAAEAGLPEGGLSVVPCDRAAADALTEDERIRLVTFTGSPEVGWGIKARAGSKRVVLELGGNAAAIVEADADLDAAVARIAIGAYYYAGQSCISVQRITVARAVYDDVKGRLIRAVKEVPYGDTRDPDTVSGPVITPADAERIDGWIDSACDFGAGRLAGGQRDGNVIRPCLLEDAPEDSFVMSREAFGPVAVLTHHDSFDEALRFVNASRFGLQAGLFTSDVRKLTRAHAALEVGAVIHDDTPAYRVDHMPYGGVKQSGFGREGARYAIADMTEPRMLVLRS